MKLTRNIVLWLFLLSVTLLVACGGGGDNNGNSSSDKKYTLILSHELATTHVKHKKMEEFAKMVEENSGGRIVTELYPSAQLYTDSDAVNAMGTESVHMVWPPTAQLEKINEEVGVVGLPFALDEKLLLESKEYKNDLNEMLTGFVKEKNILHLGLLRATGGVIITTDTRIQEIEDLKGLKMSIAGGQTQINLMKDIGANAISMPISEAPTGLSQGTIDGVQTSPSAWATGIGEIGKHGTIIEGLVPMTYSIVIDGNWFNNLPEDLQQVIVDASNEIVANFAQTTIDADKKSLEEVSSFATIDTFNEKQIEQLKEMVQPTILDFSNRFPESYSKYTEIVEKYSGQ